MSAEPDPLRAALDLLDVIDGIVDDTHPEGDGCPLCTALDDLRAALYRAWLISHWVGHRCGYVDCRITESHEHGGGQPMRETTPEERAARLAEPQP